MPKAPSLAPTYNEKRDRWALSIPPRFSSTGKRRREQFKSQAQAQERADELLKGKEISQRVADAAGPALIKTAVNYDELFRDIYGFDGGLEEACEYLAKRLDTEQQATRFGEIVASYERIHAATWKNNYRTKWRWFVNAVEELVDHTTLTMDGAYWTSWLAETCERKKWSDGTYNDLLSMLRSVWKHAVGISLVDRNPMEGIRRRKLPERPKAIYSVDEVKRLLNSAWVNDKEMVPYFAIAIFAGLRPDVDSEICRLTWADINFKEKWIRVGADFDNKTRTKRFVPIETNLMKWLHPWRKSQGRVTPENLTNRRRWLVRGKYQAAASAPESEWEELVPSGSAYRDITRHTYGSYLDAKCKDRNIVKENMGHSSFTTYEQHYRNARTPQQAEEFWSIVLPADKAP